MSRLCYIHLFEYRNLRNIGLSFDPRYDISVDEERKKISLQKNMAFPQGFWGDTVYSLTAIVGRNGTGKTTALRFVLEALAEGSGGRPFLKGVVVTINEEEQFSIYISEQQKCAFSIDRCELLVNEIENMEELPNMKVFYYGSHFNPLATPEDILTQQWPGLVNMSDGYLLARDLQDYGNELTTNGHYAFRDYATAFNIQNQYRICYFLNQYDSHIKSQLSLPRYLLLFPNEAGLWAINHRIMLEKKPVLPRYDIPKEWSLLDKALASFAYHDMINMMAEGNGSYDSWLSLIERWVQISILENKGDILNEYRKFVESISDDGHRDLCHYIYESLNMLGNFCGVKSNGIRTWFYLDIAKDKTRIDTLLEWIVGHNVFLTCRFFDMFYAHGLDSTSFLSSGEQELLNLYSRIYDSTVRINQRGFREEIPQLFIFDEAEIGYHPEWQRQYINNLILFLNDIVGSKDRFCQIIVTSHSPIILSDIPVECSNMLDSEDGTSKNLRKSRKQTFGTNVFDLYRDSFFLKEGMVGKFASVYIQNLNNEIDNLLEGDVPPEPETLSSLKPRIMLIGDRVIRDFLMSKLKPYDKKGLKDYYKRAIEELGNEQD